MNQQTSAQPKQPQQLSDINREIQDKNEELKRILIRSISAAEELKSLLAKIAEAREELARVTNSSGHIKM